MTEYRSYSVTAGGGGSGGRPPKRPRPGSLHWSERSWWNPRRWLAAPLIVGTSGALATLLGAWAQMLQGGLSAWGGLAVIGTLVTVAAIAWAQSDINYLKSKERRNGR